MNKKLIKLISSMFILSLIFSPIILDAMSLKPTETKEELTKIINNLNLKNIEIDIEPNYSKKPSDIRVDDLEEFIEVLVQLDREVTNNKTEPKLTKIEHLQDGKWVEITEEEYKDQTNEEFKEANINLSTNKITPFFSNVYKAYYTLIDNSWWMKTCVSIVEGYVHYGVEKAAPYAKYFIDDDIYPIREINTYLQREKISSSVLGNNHERLTSSWEAEVYTSISYGSFSANTRLQKFSGHILN